MNDAVAVEPCELQAICKRSRLLDLGQGGLAIVALAGSLVLGWLYSRLDERYTRKEDQARIERKIDELNTDVKELLQRTAPLR